MIASADSHRIGGMLLRVMGASEVRRAQRVRPAGVLSLLGHSDVKRKPFKTAFALCRTGRPPARRASVLKGTDTVPANATCVGDAGD